MSRPTHPSRWGALLFRVAAGRRHPSDVQEVESDLLELYEHRRERVGGRAARRGYWRDLISICLTTSWNDPGNHSRIPTELMLRDFLVTAARSLKKNRWLTASNLVGLTLSIACCLLLVRHVLNEVSYDRHQPHADRTYRVIRGQEKPTQASTSAPTGPRLAEVYPEVESSVRVFRYWNTPYISRGDVGRVEERFFFTDPTFFDFFETDLVAGSADLDAPNSVVITEEVARRYFGDGEALGGRLLFSGARELIVTGVARPSGKRSHLEWDMLASFSTIPDLLWPGAVTSWGFNAYRTYVRLRPGSNPASLDARLEGFLERESGELNATLFLEPITDIYLRSPVAGQIGPVSDINYVYILASIAALLVLLACINYTNLATARASIRAREVGVRKVLGASRSQVALQFFGESLAVVLVATFLAWAMAWAAIPIANDVLGMDLARGTLFSGEMMVWTVLILTGVGLLAGIYPAVSLSSFRLFDLIRGSSGPAASSLRRVLVVFQFTVSIALIVATLVIVKQLSFVERAGLGFDRESVLVLEVRDAQVAGSMAAFKQQLAGHSAILAATATSSIPGGTFPTADASWEGGGEATIAVGGVQTDADYAAALGLDVLAGRYLSNGAADSSSVVINQAAVSAFGWGSPENALGRTMAWGNGGPSTVVGVVRDYHVASLHEPIIPMALFSARAGSHVAVRFRTDAIPAALEHLEASWNAVAATQPFSYAFLDAELAQDYETERTSARLVAVAAILTIIIACLGLLGLAAFTAERRIKEIGIRKVMGATVWQILGLLSRDLLGLVLVAFALAVPLAYAASARWLDRFAFHTEVGPGLFLLAGAAAVSIAAVTVSYQALAAARRDPVRSLRTE